MWIIIVGGLMITLPATAVMLFSFGSVQMFPALVSFCINMLPFVVGYLMARKVGGKDGADLGH